MSEIIDLIKNSPDSIKWVGYFIAYVVAFVILIERLYGVYSKSSADRRVGKLEEFTGLKDLVGNDSSMEKLLLDARSQEAFFRLTKLNTNKKRRVELIKLLELGFLRARDIRFVNEYLLLMSGGKYKVNIGLSDVIMSFFGLVLILAIGVLMLAINFTSSANDWSVRVASLVMCSFMIFGVALSVRDNAQSLRLVLLTAKELEKLNLLDGEASFSSQVRMAWSDGRLGLIIFIAVVFFMLAISWLWAYCLKF